MLYMPNLDVDEYKFEHIDNMPLWLESTVCCTNYLKNKRVATNTETFD